MSARVLGDELGPSGGIGVPVQPCLTIGRVGHHQVERPQLGQDLERVAEALTEPRWAVAIASLQPGVVVGEDADQRME